MDLIIHSYGYSEALYHVLNAISCFANHEIYEVIVFFMQGMVMAYNAIIISISGDWKSGIKKSFYMLLFINILLLPKMSLVLKDHVTKRIEKIDNLPVAFALPVGLLENFGFAISSSFEQAFAPFDSIGKFSYFHYGMTFGARLKKEMSHVRIKSPEFIGNMQNFMKQCVVLPASVGHQFSKEDLVSSPDIWKVISEKAGKLITVDLTIKGAAMRKSCKDAVGYFDRFWEEEYGYWTRKYSNTDFAKANNSDSYVNNPNSLNNIFQKNLKAVYGTDQSADKILRQQMMINALADYQGSSFGIARARMQQENTAMISSNLAELYLPMLLVIMKCIVYASFICVVPLLIMSGFTKYVGYLTVVASLQLWPPMNAVLNMIIATYTDMRTEDIISFSTISSVTHQSDTIITVAASMQMMVPALAWWLTQLGGSGILHLANNISSLAQSGASVAGGEVATGNRSFDNISKGNYSYAMSNGFKTDHNLQYSSGMSSSQLADGTRETQFADGTKIYSSGAGITASSGETRYSLEQNRRSDVTEGISKAESMHSQNMRSFSQAENQLSAQGVSFVSSLAQRKHAGHNINYSALGEEGQILQQAVDSTVQLHEKNGYGWNQAADAGLRSAIKGDIGSGVGKIMSKIPLFNSGKTGAILSSIGKALDFSVTGEGGVKLTNSSDQSAGEDLILNKSSHANRTNSNTARADDSRSWLEEHNIDKNLSKDLKDSYETHKRLEQAVSKSSQQVQDWHQAKTIIDSTSGTASKDMSEELINRCMIEWGTGDKARIARKVSRGDADVMQVWKKMQSEDGYVSGVVNSVRSGQRELSNEAGNKQLSDFSSEYQPQIGPNNIGRHAEATAIAHGVDGSRITRKIEAQESDVKGKYNEVRGNNEESYKKAKAGNEKEHVELQKKVDKYEKDRIGHGIIGRALKIGKGKQKRGYYEQAPRVNKKEE